ncbi:MAG: SDR family NAD(P)-dependent oxidoreductase [Myxococcota bacterium]
MAHIVMYAATSAIAAAVARRLAARGDALYLIARDPAKLAVLQAELGEAVRGVDAEAGVAPSERWARATQALGTVDAVLMAQGHLPDQLETERSALAMRATFDANLTDVVAQLLPVADALEAQGRGTLAVITSVAGMRGRPRNFTYGAAKAGLSTWLRGLRSRLWPSGARVVDLRPGPVVTPMTEGHPRNPLFATPEGIAGPIVRALDRGGPRVVYLPAYWGPIMAVIRRLPEWLFQRFGFLAGR